MTYFWRRYVDDIFALIKHRKKKTILAKINDFHNSIKFTTEEENHGKLPFLDLMLYEKSNRSIGYHVYRKPTNTNKYLNYNSHHPLAHKIGVVDTLLTRAHRLSDETHIEEELGLTMDILRKNDYPNKLIKNRLDIVKRKAELNFPKKDPEFEKKRIILPYAGDVTTKIAKFLRRKLEIELGYYPGTKLSSLICNTKEKPPNTKAGIYNFKCKNCSSKYFGETQRDYEKRFAEHQSDIRRAVTTSPVSLHMAENDHQVDTTSVKLIMKEKRRYFQKFKEALCIRSTEEKMNNSQGMHINPIWCSALVTFLNYQSP